MGKRKIYICEECENEFDSHAQVIDHLNEEHGLDETHYYQETIEEKEGK